MMAMIHILFGLHLSVVLMMFIFSCMPRSMVPNIYHTLESPGKFSPPETNLISLECSLGIRIAISSLGVSGEVNGTPLQYSCLENPMDGGAWWAAVHGVDESGTRLSAHIGTYSAVEVLWWAHTGYLETIRHT